MFISHIVLINRTKDKAEKIAGKFNLVVKDYANIQAEIANADILIVATGASKPTISKELLYLKKPLLILDLSIPKNVDENVKLNTDVNLLDLDYLSNITDLKQREASLKQLSDAIELTTNAIFLWDKDHTLVMGNKIAREIQEGFGFILNLFGPIFKFLVLFLSFWSQNHVF